jgi:colanic acid/amylovoran biosynthesis glycosyltransferase
MKRPVVGHSVDPFLFGTGSWVYGQIRGLTRWRAVVVTKRRENTESFPFSEVHARDDLPLHKRLLQRASRRRRGYYPFHRQVLEAQGAALLHSHFASRGWGDLSLARELGVAHVSSFYGSDIWRRSRRPGWSERYLELFRAGSLFLVEGNAMRSKVIELGCAPEKVRIQHLGVDVSGTELRERRPDASGEIRLLAAGRAVEKKGFELAVRAFARAWREEPCLRLALMLIAGTSAEKERVSRLEALVAEEGIGEAVEFPPPLPYDEYRAYLERFHVFLAPSRHASDGDAEGGAPVTLIEMSASGMPIVASDHCDIPEVVPHERSGLIVPEGELDATADAILAMARHPERWPAYARAGRAHVEREYDLATQVAALESIYDGLAG